MLTTTDWPAGPSGSFLLGNLPEISRDWLGTLTRYAREYGDFVPLKLGPKRTVLVSHPSYLEDVLITHNRAFVKSLALRHSRRIFGQGLVTSEGDFWLRQRRTVQPSMHHRYVAKYAETMIDATRQMLARWHDGQQLDMSAELSRLTLEIVTRTLFGATITESETIDIARVKTVILAGFDRRISSLRFLIPDTVPFPGHFAYLRAARRLDDIVYRLIDRARRVGGATDSLLSVLLRSQDASGNPMTDQQIRDEMVSLLVAGHETTALTLGWAFVLLAEHPDIEAGLAREAAHGLAGEPVTIDCFNRLPYTTSIVDEALRLYPTSWVIARESIAQCQIGPFRIDPGTVVVMSQWVVHRDERFFDNAQSFRPQRWADGLAKRLPRFAYFPFGGGPRACVGNAFARMETVLLLAAITREFHLSLAPGESVAPHASATLQLNPNPRVIVTRRQTGRQSGADEPPRPATSQLVTVVD
jgi:cytochrome P450